MVRAWIADVTPLLNKACYDRYYGQVPDFRRKKADALRLDKMKAQSIGVWILWQKIRAAYDLPESTSFNLSHSGTYVMCAACMDGGPARVGCDIEQKSSMKMNFVRRYFCSEEYETIAVVANLPYYITTPIIFKLLTSTSEISKYVLMMQKEVADRICGKPNTKDYNALSVAIAYRATAKKVLSVPKTAFIPQPNVESAVVRLDIDAIQKYFPKDERLFFDLIRLCFTQRRKTLLNNLSLKYSKEQVLRMLTDLGLSPQIRSEALQIEDFIRISDYLTQQAL